MRSFGDEAWLHRLLTALVVEYHQRSSGRRRFPLPREVNLMTRIPRRRLLKRALAGAAWAGAASAQDEQPARQGTAVSGFVSPAWTR